MHPAPCVPARPVTVLVGLASLALSASLAAAAAPAATSTTTPPPPAPALDPSRGKEIGIVTEAYMTPHQEGDEEDATPATTPAQFKSKGPTKTRAQREAEGHRAHGQLRFSRDMSRAYVDVRVEGIDPATVNMFHIHCGKPGILGPILVDFSLATDIQKSLAKGTFSVEIRNEHIVKTSTSGHGPVAAFTTGCVIPSPSLGSNTPVKVMTVAGMAQLALAGELYFNLHTVNQTYYGDIRGQLLPQSVAK